MTLKLEQDALYTSQMTLTRSTQSPVITTTVLVEKPPWMAWTKITKPNYTVTN